MRKRIFVSAILVICAALSLGLYRKSISHNKINADDVVAITISADDRKYVIENDINKITEFVSLFNESKLSINEGDTTPCNRILIELKNNEPIEIWATSQGFHYVNERGKSYKISSASLSKYLNTLSIYFRKA